MSQSQFLEWQEALRLTSGLLLVQGFRLPIAIPRTLDWLILWSHETRWSRALKAAA